MTVKLFIIILAGIGITSPCLSQSSHPALDAVTDFPAKFVNKVNSRISSLESKLDKQATRYLTRLRNKEARLRRKLARKDPAAAATIFNGAAENYRRLQEDVELPQKRRTYVPYLDTITSTLRFLQQQKLPAGILPPESQGLQDALAHVGGLQSQLQRAELINRFLKERRQFLREQLERYGLGRDLRQLNKDIYYYGQYVNEYKSLLKHPEKLERKAIELLSKTTVFQDFLHKHSFLASIFRIPDYPAGNAYQASLRGLQTNSQVIQSMQQQFGTAGPNPGQSIQQNIQQAQNQLKRLKDKIAHLTTGEGGDMPEFKPNDQKTRSFFQRLEVGANLQTQRATNYFPGMSDLGLSLGYKLNDKSVIGIGMSYTLGLGSGWRDIQLSSEGLGLRSFLDWKLHKSFWLSGGFEMNYRNAFHDVDQLKDLSAWQQSGLVGISKVVSLKTKFFKKTRVQVLWDFLSYRQAPQTAAVKFRVGYVF